MKKLLILFFVCFGFLAKAQVFTPMTAAGYQNKRTKTDSTNYIPTFCGVPTLRSTVAQKQGAIALDSCNKIFYFYDPKTETWNQITGGGSTINIFNDTTILICSGTNVCDTFITNVTANYVSIFNDSTLIVCNTEGACDTININPTNFGVSVVSFTKNATQDSIILTLSDNTRYAVRDNNAGFDTTTVYQNIQNVYNYFSDTSFTNQFFPRGDGVLLDTVIRITDSTLRFIYTDGTQKEDTFRIALTQENITNITNIINYIDSLRGNDTTFILSASNLQSGLKALYSTTDSLSGNDTLHLEFPHNNIAEDSVLTTDVDGDLKMKLVTSGTGGAIGNIGSGYRWITTNGTNAKTFFAGLGILIDSTTNPNGLTITHDTSYGKKYFLGCLNLLNDSTVVVDTACIRSLFSYTGENYLSYNNSTGVLTGSPVNLATSNVTGVLPIANGGTNNGSLSVTAGTIYYGDGTKIVGLAPGTSRQHLTGGTIPVWRDTATGGGGVSGSGLQYQVAYWDPTNTITGHTSFVYNPSITAASGSARAFKIRPTLTAAANLDSLFAVIISPTYTNGAFTGLKQFDLRTDSDIVVNGVRMGRGKNGLVSNTAVGNLALNSITTGSSNTAIGPSALSILTTGTGNTSVGNSANAIDTIGSNNTAIGAGTLALNTVSANTAVGWSALATNSTGANNTGVGSQALFINATGGNNTAVGAGSLFKTTAGENVAVGAGAIGNATGGGATRNTVMGYNAGNGITSGTENIAIGRSALNSVTTGTGNVVIGGYLTGWQLTSNYNTMLGWESGYRLTSGAGNVFIGKLAGANGSLATLSNKLVIANDSAAVNQLMFGDFSTGQLLINANTITPAVTASAQLEVNSTTRGFLLPRMTKTQRDAIGTPVAGLAVYQTDNTPGLRVYNGTNWMRFTETAD